MRTLTLNLLKIVGVLEFTPQFQKEGKDFYCTVLSHIAIIDLLSKWCAVVEDV
jgi:hypothetical protein